MEKEKCKIVEREELYEMVWKEPATNIAKHHGLSYQDFKAICDKLSVPLPKAGHWSKVRAGKASPILPLPTAYSGPNEAAIVPVPKKRTVALQEEHKREVIGHNKKVFKVPSKLSSPDKLILKAKEQLENKKAYLHDGLVFTHAETLSIKVSPYCVGRAIRFMDTLIKALRAKGHSFNINHRGSYVIIEGEEIDISLREKLNRTIVPGKYYNSSVNKPIGILIFRMGPNYWGKEWKDGKLNLEENLADIVAALELKGKREKEERIQREVEEAKRLERARVQHEFELEQEKELILFKKLLHEAQQWQQAQQLRNYIEAVKAKALSQGIFSETLTTWLDWASKKADWYDPQINRRDELLDEVEKATLTIKKKSSIYW